VKKWVPYILIGLSFLYTCYGLKVWKDWSYRTIDALRIEREQILEEYRQTQFELLDIKKELGMVPSETLLGQED